MSIKAYVGRMGSGKTYEVVSVVILGALRRGRRVVTNIAGIDYQAMIDLLIAEGIDPDRIGRIVQVPHERVATADFWLTEQGNEDAKAKMAAGEGEPEAQGILPGDLVALDEIWRFWSGFATRDAEGSKRPQEVMNFMRMHRHFTHPESGIACDLALITQDVMDISRQVRAVIEETYLMTKHTAVGRSNRYRVDVCQGGQSRRVLRSLQRAYEEKYFALYKSHSGRKEGEAGPREENIDQRGNILSGALFKFILPIGALVAVFAVWTVYKFLNPAPKAQVAVADKPASIGAAAPVSHARSQPDESSGWRVVGWISDARMRVVLSNGQVQRIIEPPNWRMTGATLETFLPSGDAVTPWSGRGSGGLLEQGTGVK